MYLQPHLPPLTTILYMLNSLKPYNMYGSDNPSPCLLGPLEALSGCNPFWHHSGKLGPYIILHLDLVLARTAVDAL